MLTFAWVDADEADFLPEHARADLEIVSVVIAQEEGQFAEAILTVKNPRVGLLSPGRKVWAWIGWDDDDTAAVPLFFGHLRAWPTDFLADAVDLQFLAEPDDFLEQKQAVAAALKEFPFYDPIWFGEEDRDDADAIIQARTVAWHIDRTSLTVSVSDLVAGEDGTLIIPTEHEGFDQSLNGQFVALPKSSIRVTADVYWRQHAAGSVDVSPRFVQAAAAAGSQYGLIQTYTGEGLLRDIPKKSQAIGSGWRWGDMFVVRGEKKFLPEEFEQVEITGKYSWYINFPLWSFKPDFNVEYEVDRSFQERVTFTLTADIQALPGRPDEPIELDLSSRYVGEPVDDPDTTSTAGDKDVPIGDLRRRSYFQTARGQQSIDYLMMLAAADLISRARAVLVQCDITLRDGFGLSLRKSATITTPRLPGGTATGKIVAYQIIADGVTGTNLARLTIACTIGHDGSVAPSAGTPVWVSADWVEPGWQVYQGQQMQPSDDVEVYWEIDDLIKEPDDDGVDFYNLSYANVFDEDTTFGGLQMVNGRTAQEELIQALRGGTPLVYSPAPTDPMQALNALNEVYSQFHGQLIKLRKDPFLTEYELTVSELDVPKTIDLEAA